MMSELTLCRIRCARKVAMWAGVSGVFVDFFVGTPRWSCLFCNLLAWNYGTPCCFGNILACFLVSRKMLCGITHFR